MSGRSNSLPNVRAALQDAMLRAGRASPLLWLAVALWLVALALAVLVLPAQYAALLQDQQKLLQAQSAQAQRAQDALQNSAATSQPLSNRESSQRNAAQFKALLANAPLPEGAQKTLFTLAKRWELELPQGQYKLACDASGAWCSYRMQLPVVGSYTAVRGFVQDALHALPSLSLDGAAFKRDAAASGELEVALRWTLYQPPVRADGDAR
jgi:Tfp pilus assembly protein PilN